MGSAGGSQTTVTDVEVTFLNNGGSGELGTKRKTTQSHNIFELYYFQEKTRYEKLTIFKGCNLSPLTKPRPYNSGGIHAEFVDRERLEVSDRKIKSLSTEQNCFSAASFLNQSIANYNSIRQRGLFPCGMYGG